MGKIWGDILLTIKHIAMSRKLLLILVLLQCSLISQSQYKWLNPLPQGNTLRSVYFSDENTGYAVGNLGTALMTIDGGKNWSILNTNTTKNLNDVYFINANYGFAVGDSGTIIKTINHGATWSTLVSGVNENLYSVFFTDSLTGHSCGQNGKIIKTTDGGNQWDTKTSNVNAKLYSIDFPSTETGYFVGELYLIVGAHFYYKGFVLKSTDGGDNWTLLTDSLSKPLYTSDFTDTIKGFAAGGFVNGSGGGYLIKTEDGGNNWHLVNGMGDIFVLKKTQLTFMETNAIMVI
jgi:photosystem II stability/assembly factor-like uncharacterized protein